MKHNRKFFSNQILKKIVSPIEEKTIASFDIETYGYMNKFYLGGLYTDKYYSFYNRNDMINFINENCKDSILFATNLMFDFQALYYNQKEWVDYKIIMRNGVLITASHNKIHFSDTLNYVPFGVKALGKFLSIDKLEGKNLIGKIPKTEYMERKLRQYNKIDCLITRNFMLEFQKAINFLGAELKMTIASTSLNLYLRKYIPFTIFKEPFNCREFIHEGYYGGRTECFSRGRLNRKKKYYWYDFNSMYPFCMLNKYPLPSSAKKLKYKRKYTNTKIIMKYEGMSRVKVFCPYMYYPLLPVWLNGKLTFPVGTFEGVYTHIELREAMKKGYIIENISETLYYTKTFYPFKKFVTDMYKLKMKYKKNNNVIMEQAVKLLMNSLYGKFATKDMQDIKFYDIQNKYYTDSELIGVQMTSRDTGYKENEKECIQNYVMPILSAYTTAYGRIMLHNLLEQAEALYCDTDSGLTEKEIIISKKLGGLKLEKLISDGYIIRPKLYAIYDINKITEGKHKGKSKGWNITTKGIRRPTIQTIWDIMNNKAIRQEKFMKIKEAINRDYNPNQRHIMYKKQSLEDNKRLWNGRFDKTKLEKSFPIHL